MYKHSHDCIVQNRDIKNPSNDNEGNNRHIIIIIIAFLVVLILGENYFEIGFNYCGECMIYGLKMWLKYL